MKTSADWRRVLWDLLDRSRGDGLTQAEREALIARAARLRKLIYQLEEAAHYAKQTEARQPVK